MRRSRWSSVTSSAPAISAVESASASGRRSDRCRARRSCGRITAGFPELVPRPSGAVVRRNPAPRLAGMRAGSSRCIPAGLIGATGFEPATFRPPAECATRLRHAPRWVDLSLPRMGPRASQLLAGEAPGLCRPRDRPQNSHRPVLHSRPAAVPWTWCATFIGGAWLSRCRSFEWPARHSVHVRVTRSSGGRARGCCISIPHELRISWE
jgi:hypothetical protein